MAALFWEAFQRKLRLFLRPDEKALSFIASVLDPRFALCARDKSGTLLGVAGFKTAQGALVGGGFSDLAKVYGWLGALWRGLPLGLLERDLKEGTLLMDGIFVTAEARGRGVGTALLEAIKAHAADAGETTVRLDVIDTNPRARALYLRQGFEPRGKSHLGPLAPLFGFKSAEEMVFTLQPKAE